MTAAPGLLQIVDLELELRARARNRPYEQDPWLRRARSTQLMPEGDWHIWIIQTGRGWGKTLTVSETTNLIATYSVPLLGVRAADLRIALVGRTAADVRDVMVEGLSGVLRTGRPWNRPVYEPSKRRITWPNGVVATTFSAQEPDLLRGPEHHFAWSDEVATWERGQETWDNLQMGLRQGAQPRQVVTTTPRRTAFYKALVALDGTVFTRGHTDENRANLSASFFEQVASKYRGTRLGRQELAGELLEDREGALWTLDMIDAGRVEESPVLLRVVVGVDPAGGGRDETGIVVAGQGANGHYYIMDDVSERSSPESWGRAAVGAYHKWMADRIIAEKNYGGDMVQSVIRNVDRKVPYKAVTATRGKALRAEPIAALYEQGRVHHVGVHRELEDQMTNWAPGDAQSPDRLDAATWALTELSTRGGWAVS